MKLSGIRFNEAARKFHGVEFLVDDYEALTKVEFGERGMERMMSDAAVAWLDKQAEGWSVSFNPRFRKMVASVWLPSESAAIMFKMTFG